MTKGALLFAFNTEETDYVKMADIASQRINHFLDIPCTLVTDNNIELVNTSFDKIIYLPSDKSNSKNKKVWINKGRYRAYDVSPYQETMLIDTDYVVNSRALANVFNFYNDFNCHNSTSFLMHPATPQEKLGMYSMNALWATVMFFKKSTRVKQLFECMQMVQENYDHYRNLHGFNSSTFRNDYALTISNRIMNGHIDNKADFIPWNLLHVSNQVTVTSEDTQNFNTEFKITLDIPIKNKKEFIIIKDTDFHMLDKNNFMELFNE